MLHSRAMLLALLFVSQLTVVVNVSAPACRAHAAEQIHITMFSARFWEAMVLNSISTTGEAMVLNLTNLVISTV